MFLPTIDLDEAGLTRVRLLALAVHAEPLAQTMPLLRQTSRALEKNDFPKAYITGARFLNYCSRKRLERRADLVPGRAEALVRELFEILQAHRTDMVAE